MACVCWPPELGEGAHNSITSSVEILQLSTAAHHQAQGKGLAMEQPHAARDIITFLALLLSSFTYKTDSVKRSNQLLI